MVSTRRKHYDPSPNKPHRDCRRCRNPPEKFKTLISALESAEVVKSPLLKSSYSVLIQLSSHQQSCLEKAADPMELVMGTAEGQARVHLSDLCRLFDMLFKELQKRLQQFLSTSPSLEPEELVLLIRCCMILLTLPLPQEHLLEHGRVLLLILKKLSFLGIAEGCNEDVLNFKKLLSHKQMSSGENSSKSFAKVASLLSLEPVDLCIPFLSAILEVLMDELLVHRRLRKYFQLIDSLSPTDERLFKHGSNRGDFGMILDIICSHFSLSISEEGALSEFLNRITSVHAKNLKAPALGMIAARSLLQSPVVLSSPKLLQTHIILLVSDVIGADVGYEKLTIKSKFLDCYLSVFESSILFYTKHMSSLQTEKHSVSGTGALVNVYDGSFQPSLEPCIGSSKREKLDHLMTNLYDSWNSNLRNKFSETKSELVTSCTEYIQESQRTLDPTCRDEVLSFLSYIVQRAANDASDIELLPDGYASLQDICLLASLLKLMSYSLLQVVWCLRHGSDQQCTKTSKDLAFCKEYDFILRIIGCFKEFRIRLPIQKFSYSMTHSMKHKESRLMLLHFLGLLSLCFKSGLDFLVKSCMSTIMALTNLFILEEGNIDALRSLADRRSLPPERALVTCKENLALQSCTVTVASKFQKIQTLYVSMSSVACDSTQKTHMEARNSSASIPPNMTERVAREDKTSSGEIYLKTVLQNSADVPDFDDLADFVECKKGKDYVGWLKDREKYRQWKLVKKAKSRSKNKQQTWRSMNGKKH